MNNSSKPIADNLIYNCKNIILFFQNHASMFLNKLKMFQKNVFDATLKIVIDDLDF